MAVFVRVLVDGVTFLTKRPGEKSFPLVSELSPTCHLWPKGTWVCVTTCPLGTGAIGCDGETSAGLDSTRRIRPTAGRTQRSFAARAHAARPRAGARGGPGRLA